MTEHEQNKKAFDLYEVVIDYTKKCYRKDYEMTPYERHIINEIKTILDATLKDC